MQSLHTSRNLILIGVPSDVDPKPFQMKIHKKMEEARQNMLARNLSKYGTIAKVPKFVLEKDFIKNMPSAEWSDKDDISFWSCMPFHLECVVVDEDHLVQILAYMYQVKRFQVLIGEAALYYKNPGPGTLAGEHSTLAGILMRHIAMVRLIGHFSIRGLHYPHRRFPLTKFDDDDLDKVNIRVNHSMRELMMEKKIHGTKIWTLIAQTQDGCWVGYYHFRVGNKGHKKLALECSGYFCPY
jgi:hypothetical protein